MNSSAAVLALLGGRLQQMLGCLCLMNCHAQLPFHLHFTNNVVCTVLAWKPLAVTVAVVLQKVKNLCVSCGLWAHVTLRNFSMEAKVWRQQ